MLCLRSGVKRYWKRSWFGRVATLPGFLAMMLISPPLAAQQAIQIFYVSLPEEAVLSAFQALDTSASPLSGDTSIRTVIGKQILVAPFPIVAKDQTDFGFELPV